MTSASKQPMRLGKLFSPKGRTRRLPFAMAAIIIQTAWQLPSPVVTILLLIKVPVYGWAFEAVLLILAGLAWPLACLAAKRLHDIGLSGWPGVIYLAYVPSVLLSLYSNSRPLGYLPDAIMTFARPWLYDAGFWLPLLATVILIILPGNKGENRFGADPRQAAQPAADLF